jgi:hypothetical protein
MPQWQSPESAKGVSCLSQNAALRTVLMIGVTVLRILLAVMSIEPQWVDGIVMPKLFGADRYIQMF